MEKVLALHVTDAALIPGSPKYITLANCDPKPNPKLKKKIESVYSL